LQASLRGECPLAALPRRCAVAGSWSPCAQNGDGIGGASPPAHLAGWKDVALVEDEAELLVKFSQPATREHPFMYHCHVLEHEDAGMMGQYICT